jgi:FixJ family two-component response regulator
VDDDDSVRSAMERLIKSMGMEVRSFDSAEALLNSEIRQDNACLILDVKMPGVSGLELQQKLKALGYEMPVIFITAFDSGNVRDSVKMAGAAGYFLKPVDDRAILDAINWALSGHPLEES